MWPNQHPAPAWRLCALAVFWWALVVGVSAAHAANTASAPDDKRFVAIDFNDVDIGVFIKFISELTGKNFVIDQRIKGKVTIISPGKISVAEAYKVFESVLEVYGYSAIAAGEIIKIVPAIDARSMGVETYTRPNDDDPEDKIVTQIIPLKYADPAELKKLFTPLIAKGSVMMDYEPTNTLIVTDVYANIKRLMKIINTIDVTGVGQELSVIPLNYADAAKFAKLLAAIFQEKSAKSKIAPDNTIKFVADDRTNTLIVMASNDETRRIKRLIDMLDRDVPRGDEKVRVYYLENAVADDLAKTLQTLTGNVPAGVDEGGKKTAPVVSGRVKITSDKATNSLIIMADKDDYRVIEDIIQKLDIPRTMVYIEALIMEVNVDKDFNIGTEWTAMKEVNYNGKTGGIGGGFSGAKYQNLLGMITPSTLTGVSAGYPDGLAMAVVGETIEIAGIKFPSIAAVVQAYKKDSDVHILSTPQIFTTDNEEANIYVGSNIPYQTKSGVAGTSESFNTYEYKDVGITMKITPIISKDRMVQLKISQEVTKLTELNQTDANADRPSTLKRTIDTTVIVRDGNTVVIGGLIDDSFSNTEYRVPCLGDIPGLGWLFKSISKSREKTNLFFFLTPHVVETPEEAEALYQQKQNEADQIGPAAIELYPQNQPPAQSVIQP